MDTLAEMKGFLQNIEQNDIHFKKHFYDNLNIKHRPINEGLVRATLKKTDNLLHFEQLISKFANEQKFKLWFKLSHKYRLVLIAITTGKDLNIVTGWNTNRKWQKDIQK